MMIIFLLFVVFAYFILVIGPNGDTLFESKDDCKSTLAIRYLLLIEISAALQAFIMAKNIKVMFY